MTDEDVLEIAQALTQDEWYALGLNVRGQTHYDSDYDATLITKGVVARGVGDDSEVSITSVGYKVWEWRALFWDEGGADSPGGHDRRGCIGDCTGLEPGRVGHATMQRGRIQ